MKEGPDITRIASLIGDPARANILTMLMTGKALTASELAREAGITPQTGSSHLSKLEKGRLIRQRQQGRHKYFSLANNEVAQVIEALMGLASSVGHVRVRTGPKDAALREARVCYNHLAGRMGTDLYDHMVQRGHLILEHDEVCLSASGEAFAKSLGVDVKALRALRAPLCRECLDWSERRSHLAGSLGRAILARMEALGWARRDPNSRALLFSQKGKQRFMALLEDHVSSLST